MACSFNFEIPVDPIGLMQMARQVLEQNGGIVTGEISNFSVRIPTVIGEVGGNCRHVGGTVVNIEVTQKPPIVTSAMAREKLVVYISEAVKMYVRQIKAAQQQENETAEQQERQAVT